MINRSLALLRVLVKSFLLAGWLRIRPTLDRKVLIVNRQNINNVMKYRQFFMVLAEGVVPW